MVSPRGSSHLDLGSGLLRCVCSKARLWPEWLPAEMTTRGQLQEGPSPQPRPLVGGGPLDACGLEGRGRGFGRGWPQQAQNSGLVEGSPDVQSNCAAGSSSCSESPGQEGGLPDSEESCRSGEPCRLLDSWVSTRAAEQPPASPVGQGRAGLGTQQGHGLGSCSKGFAVWLGSRALRQSVGWGLECSSHGWGWEMQG